MIKKKVIFDFGSTNISIFSDDMLLLRIPTVIIMKRSLHSGIIFYGEEALEKRNQMIGEEFMWVRPIQKGAIAHYEGAKLLIKEILHKLFGYNTNIEICVLISCGLEVEQKKDIEKIFVTNGYSNVYLLESILALSPILEQNESNVVCVLGGDLVDVGVISTKKNGEKVERKIISGYSLGLGGNVINEKIKKSIELEYKLQVSDKEVEEIKLKVGSLFIKDMSSYSCNGLDIISGKKKKMTLTNREIYKSIIFVYTRIIKLIDGVLLVAPDDILKNILKKGIVIVGGGAQITGLEEYFFNNLELPIILEDKPYITHLRSAYRLINDEVFIKDFLGE
ncbi:MAG: rod shape-determining protein [Clostridia bacterium]